MTEPFVFTPSPEAKRFAPATQRNRDPIVSVLREVLPEKGQVLEIASGTGEHIVHFAAYFPHLRWQPSDFDPAGLESISAWIAESRLPNIAPPVQLDAAKAQWPVGIMDAIVCINMIHISPWSATEGFLRGRADCLNLAHHFISMAPIAKQAAKPLRAMRLLTFRCVRPMLIGDCGHVEDVVAVGKAAGFNFQQKIEMPANNLSLVFRKTV